MIVSVDQTLVYGEVLKNNPLMLSFFKLFKAVNIELSGVSCNDILLCNFFVSITVKPRFGEYYACLGVKPKRVRI